MGWPTGLVPARVSLPRLLKIGMTEASPHIGVLLHDFQLGGSERIAIRLARAWAAGGRRVTLFAGEGSGPLRELAGTAVSITARDEPGAARRGIVGLARWAAGAARAAGVSVMFLPGNSYFRAIGPLHRRGFRVVTKVSNRMVRPGRSALRNLFFRAACSIHWLGLDALVICSEGEAAEIRRVVRLPFPPTIIPNPILDALPPPAARRIPGQFCAVGRLEPQKNYPLLLESFALLRDLPVTLKIAGDGSLRASLMQLAARLGIAERVEFLGNVREVMPLMAQSEALLLSSDYEGYPAVCVEALAAGTSVIARDGGAGVRDILGAPRIGVIVTGTTAQAFADAVRTWRDERGFDADAARAVAARYLIAPIAARYLQLLDAA